ncbi:hypothetical protein DICA3_E20406 [Diutina catenulata]
MSDTFAGINAHYASFYNRHVKDTYELSDIGRSEFSPSSILPNGDVYVGAGGPGVSWSPRDKELFFGLLGRYSIHRADLIAESLGKPECDVLIYYQALKDAARNYRRERSLRKEFKFRVDKVKHKVTLRQPPSHLIRYSDIPIAYEMSEDYIVFEEKQSVILSHWDDRTTLQKQRIRLKQLVDYCERATVEAGIDLNHLYETFPEKLSVYVPKDAEEVKGEPNIGDDDQQYAYEVRPNLIFPTTAPPATSTNRLEPFPSLINSNQAEKLGQLYQRSPLFSNTYLERRHGKHMRLTVEAHLFLERLVAVITRNIIASALSVLVTEKKPTMIVSCRHIKEAVTRLGYRDTDRTFNLHRYWIDFPKRLQVPIIANVYANGEFPEAWKIMTPQEWTNEVLMNVNSLQTKYNWETAQAANLSFTPTYPSEPSIATPKPRSLLESKKSERVASIRDIRHHHRENIPIVDSLMRQPEYAGVVEKLNQLEAKYIDQRDVEESRVHEHALLTLLKTGYDIDPNDDPYTDLCARWHHQEEEEVAELSEWIAAHDTPEQAAKLTEAIEGRAAARVSRGGIADAVFHPAVTRACARYSASALAPSSPPVVHGNSTQGDLIEENSGYMPDEDTSIPVKVTPALVGCFEAEFANYSDDDSELDSDSESPAPN